MKRFLVTFSALPPIIFFLSLTAYSQSSKNQTVIWANWSQAMTDLISQDSVSVSVYNRALINAKLGDAWWATDAVRSRSYFQKAFKTLQILPKPENLSERKVRSETLRTLLKITLTKDSNLSQKILNLLSQEDAAFEEETKANGKALAEAADSLAESNPERAFSFALAAIRLEKPVFALNFYWKMLINKKNGDMAKSLFSEAVGISKSNDELRQSLFVAAFPEKFGLNSRPATSSDLLLKLLRVITENLQTQAILVKNGQQADCFRAAIEFTQLNEHFVKLMPEQITLLSPAVEFCQAPLKLNSSVKEIASGEKQLTTVDDFLEAAKEQDEPRLKFQFQSSAAKLAAKQKDLKRAIGILDDMDTGTRNFIIDAWNEWRWEWAALLIIEQLKTNDLTGMYQTLRSVPIELRPSTQIYVVGHLTEGQNVQIATEFLLEARQILSKSSEPQIAKAYSFLSISKFYAKYQLRVEATEALQDAIDSVNRAAQEDLTDSDIAQTEQSLIEWSNGLLNFPTSFVEADFQTFYNSTSSIKPPAVRAEVRLQMLKLALASQNKNGIKAKKAI